MSYKEEEFRYHLRKAYTVILIIVILLAAGLLVKYQIDNQVFSRCEVTDRLEKVGSENSVYENCNGNLLCYSIDGVSAYDTGGRQLWNQTFQMQSVMVKSAGDYVVAADYQGTVLYLMGKEGLITTVETNMPILSVDVSAQGIAIAQTQEGDTVYMQMYDKDGSVITTYRTTMRNFGYPLAYTISPDNYKMGVSYLKAAGGEIGTSLAFYNFSGVGQNEADNLVSAYECKDEVVPIVAFPQEDTAFAVGGKKIRLFSGKQKPALQKEIELGQEIHAVYHNENYFALVLDADSREHRYNLYVYDLSGNEKLKIDVDFEYTDICVENNRVVVYNQTQMLMAGYNGVVKYDGELPGGVLKIIPLDTYSRFLFVYADKLEKVRFR